LTTAHNGAQRRTTAHNGAQRRTTAHNGAQRRKAFRVFEGFAGYGGASFALKKSKIKHRVIGYSELDKFACALFEANHPGIPNFGDITQIDPAGLPDFDLFTGGFPCQPFSSAGMQMGELDKYGRGTLIHYIFEICEVKKPKYILLENVKGLTAKKFEPTFNAIKRRLKEMGYGDIAYALLNTKDYGIPQNRERIWIFARLGGLPDNFSMIPPKKKLAHTIADFLDQEPPLNLYLSEAQIAHLKVKHKIPSFEVQAPLCLDIYNKKIKYDGICITITDPMHNSLRVIEPPKDGKEIVRKMSVMEQFRLMGFRDGEIDFAGQSYAQLSKRAGNGWDINLVSILLAHIWRQL
jgi:DNA (cytosine-5)-methyltransferase 1